MVIKIYVKSRPITNSANIEAVACCRQSRLSQSGPTDTLIGTFTSKS